MISKLSNFFFILFCLTLFTQTASAQDNNWVIKIGKLYDQGDSQNAISEANKYLEKYPDDARIHSLKGWILIDLGQKKEAEISFNQAIKIDGNWDNAYVGKGSLARRSGNYKSAQKYYEKALSIKPDDAYCLSSLTSLEINLGNYKKAIELGEKAWGLNKTDPAIPANLSIAYHYAGEIEKRDKLFNEAKKLGYSSIKNLENIFSGEQVIPVVKLEDKTE